MFDVETSVCRLRDALLPAAGASRRPRGLHADGQHTRRHGQGNARHPKHDQVQRHLADVPPRDRGLRHGESVRQHGQ